MLIAVVIVFIIGISVCDTVRQVLASVSVCVPVSVNVKTAKTEKATRSQLDITR